jgi:hypothetical protein
MSWLLPTWMTSDISQPLAVSSYMCRSSLRTRCVYWCRSSLHILPTWMTSDISQPLAVSSYRCMSSLRTRCVYWCRSSLRTKCVWWCKLVREFRYYNLYSECWGIKKKTYAYMASPTNAASLTTRHAAPPDIDSAKQQAEGTRILVPSHRKLYAWQRPARLPFQPSTAAVVHEIKISFR